MSYGGKQEKKRIYFADSLSLSARTELPRKTDSLDVIWDPSPG